MREIEFRAWDKKKKRWVAWNKCELFINYSLTEPYFYIHDESETGNDNIAIMQYTGRKDAHGVKAFHKDTVRRHMDGYIDEGTIEWVHDGWALVDQDGDFMCDLWDVFNAYNGEVIGNIYDKNTDR